MKRIETFSIHEAGNITRREGALRGGDIPRLTVTVELGAPPHETAEQLRRLAAILDRQPALI